MSPAAIPVMPRGVRTQFDAVRGTEVLLGPERALMLDEIGAAVLAEVNGSRTVAGIAGELARRYGAPEDAVLADVSEFLQGLVDKRLLDVCDA